MLKVEKTETYGWEAAIQGMRNPMNSWDKSDTKICDAYQVTEYCEGWGYNKCPYGDNCEKGVWVNDFQSVHLGEKDQDLMKRLCKAGTDHRKFMRMIVVYCDITAPLYWWKEFKTYRAGKRFGDYEPGLVDNEYLEYDVEMNSCSTMHKIHSKEFEIDDFSHEHLMEDEAFARPLGGGWRALDAHEVLCCTIEALNTARKRYLITKNKKYWWQIIQLLPSSYNQKRTLMLNYEVLANMYKSRKNHKLDEWRSFCAWIETLPFSELITGEE